MVDFLERGLTRRDALRGSLAGGALLVAGGLIGCGSDDGGGAGTSTSAGGAVGQRRRGGTLRIGLIGASNDTIDAQIGTVQTVGSSLYFATAQEGLTEIDRNGRPRLALAEELTSNADATSWTVRLREGLTFHDGKPITADDVIYSLRRILEPRNGAGAALFLASVDPKRLRKRDARTVEINLKQADVSIESALGRNGSAIVPVGYDGKRPNGAGAFKVESFKPTERVVFVRHDGYWRENEPYLDELVFVSFRDQTAVFNALTSGTIDGAGRIAAEQVALAQGNPKLGLVRSQTNSFDVVVMATDRGPFADARVRQAMRAMLDRQQFVDQVYAGYGRLGNDLPALGDPMYPGELPQREQDLELARSLLRQAGAEGLAVTFHVRPESPFMVPAAQVFAEQAKAIGANVKIQQIADVGQFYAKYYGQTALQSDYYLRADIWSSMAWMYLPGAPYNTSHWRDASAARLFLEARGTLDEAKRKELFGEAQRIFWETSGWAVPAYIDTHDVLSTRFTGARPDQGGVGLNGGRFREIGLAA